MIEKFQEAVEHAQRAGFEHNVDIRLCLIGGGIEIEVTHWSYKTTFQVPYMKIGQHNRALILAIDSLIEQVKYEAGQHRREPGRHGWEGP